MPNNITLPENYTQILDEVYAAEAVTSDLSVDEGMVEVLAPGVFRYQQVTVGGLGDYDKELGYTSAGVTLDWVPVIPEYDRGAVIRIDAVDDEETNHAALTRAGAALQREKAAPESDAYVFAKLAGMEGISKADPVTYANAEEFMAGILAAVTQMDEDEVPQEGRILYATSTLLNSIIAMDTYKSRELLESFSKVKKVPQKRFYTAIDLLDGRSEGEELGHFRKAEGAADINFMIVHKPAVIKIDKHTASDLVPASSNTTHDAHVSKYRKYGVVDVYKNKVKGIYLSHKPTA